jgi:hypothetical protein
MRFSVDRLALVKMLKLVQRKAPGAKKRDKLVRLSACPAKVFIEANEAAAGVEALVLEEGTCALPHDILLRLLQSYHPKPQITIEIDARALRMGTTTLNAVVDYSPQSVPPMSYQIFPVTDLGVTGRKPQPP